jgi:hypothetical protein
MAGDPLFAPNPGPSYLSQSARAAFSRLEAPCGLVVLSLWKSGLTTLSATQCSPYCHSQNHEHERSLRNLRIKQLC